MRYLLLAPVGVVCASGCKYEIVPCTDDEARYIKATVSWMHEYSDEIAAAMEETWQDPRISYSRLLSDLSLAEIQCGIGLREGDDIPASQIGRRIIIDVSNENVRHGLSLFLQAEWVAGYTLAALSDPGTVDYTTVDPLSDLWQYQRGLSSLAYLLNHEGAHLIFGSHRAPARQELEQLDASSTATESGLDYEDTAGVDEIYAWGYAAILAADGVYTDQKTELMSYVDAR